MASNNHINLGKIEKFIRGKYDPDDILKDRGKKTSSRESCMNFKITDGHLTYKRKRRVIFDYDKKKFNTTTSLYFIVIQYSFTTFELQTKWAT